jgi:hypothetical protein
MANPTLTKLSDEFLGVGNPLASTYSVANDDAAVTEGDELLIVIAVFRAGLTDTPAIATPTASGGDETWTAYGGYTFGGFNTLCVCTFWTATASADYAVGDFNVDVNMRSGVDLSPRASYGFYTLCSITGGTLVGNTFTTEFTDDDDPIAVHGDPRLTDSLAIAAATAHDASGTPTLTEPTGWDFVSTPLANIGGEQFNHYVHSKAPGEAIADFTPSEANAGAGIIFYAGTPAATEPAARGFQPRSRRVDFRELPYQITLEMWENDRG